MNARPDTIYIAKPVGLSGPYKIGVTSNLARRFRHICNQSPIPMELICSAPGDPVIERRIHASLLHAHCRCEWFDDCDEIQSLIASIKTGKFTGDGLPAPKGVAGFVRGKPAERKARAA